MYFGILPLKTVKLLLPYLVSAILAFFIFQIHMSNDVDSMLNEKNNVISNGFLVSQINYHKEFAPFARRPLTTFLIESTSTMSGITLGLAFVWVNFILLFLSGILLFRLSLILDSGYLKGILNVILYFLSFSVIFAFFPPIFSYDEPLQYCLIFAGLTSYLKRQWVGYLLWFTAAIIARENSAFLILGLVFFAPEGFLNKSEKLVSGELIKILIGLPILFYIIFIILFIEANGLWMDAHDEFRDRFSCLKENFLNMQNTIETLISIILTLGIYIYFLLGSFKLHKPLLKEKIFVNAFILSCLVNTTIVLIAAFSREARLFALPLVFLWPIMAQYCYEEIRLLLTFKIYLRCFSKWRYNVALGIVTLLNYLISFLIYIPSFPSSDNYFNEYLFFLIQFLSLHFLLRHYADRNPLAHKRFTFSLKGKSLLQTSSEND